MLMVIFTVLMMLWLFGGAYWNWDASRPATVANMLIPWLCVAILGWVVFNGGHAVVLRP